MPVRCSRFAFLILAGWLLTPAPGRAQTLYVSDKSNNAVYKVSSSGAVSTFASGLSSCNGLAFDSNNNLYVVSQTNNTISEITPSGSVTTFASLGGGPLPFRHGILWR